MRVKNKSVNIDCLKDVIKSKLHYLDALITSYTGGECVITSGCELTAEHMVGSKHYTGEAIDIRTWGIYAMRAEDIKNFMNNLYEIFPDSQYDIVKEKDHIHIEFDPHISHDIPDRRELPLNEYHMDYVKIPTVNEKIELPIFYKFEHSPVLKDFVRVGKFAVNLAGKYYTGITIFRPNKSKISTSLNRLIEALIKLINVLIERVKK